MAAVSYTHLPFLSIVAQPKHEVRAAWVTAVYGLDWPRTRATTPVSYTHLDVYKRQVSI